MYPFAQSSFYSVPPDSIGVRDTAGRNKTTVVVLPDSLKKTDTTKRDGIKTAVKYASEDSIVFDATSQTMKLYGESKIDYGDMSLKAEQIDINWLNNNVEAKGVPDSTGKLQGTPLFKDKDQEYATTKIVYNFKSKKGIINGVITKQGDGFVHGERVKKNEDNELFVQHSQYTTCNLAEPHFSIASSKIKMIPDKKVISGPFHLIINKIHTPIGFLFGYFPIPKNRSSGFIIPSYGESQSQGFFLQNGGFYLAANKYMGLKFLGDIYSLGGAGAQQLTDYRKNYAFEGNFNFKYNWLKTYTVLEGSKSFDTHSFWVLWTHRTTSKKPNRLTININAGTTRFNQISQQQQSISQTLGSEFMSSISYSRAFRTKPFSLGVNLRQTQTIAGVKTFNLPDVNFGVNRIYPFQNLGGGKQTELLRKLNLSYQVNLQNQITNNPSVIGYKNPGKDTIINGEVVRRPVMYNYADDFDYLINSKNLNNGIRHSIPLSTTIKVLKYFSVSPNANYDEVWYNRKLGYEVRDTVLAQDSGRVTQYARKDTVSGLTRYSTYSAGVNLTTRIFGTAFIRAGRLEAIRHTMVPTLGFTYKPDFSDEKYGSYTHKKINGNDVRLSNYEGFSYGAPGMGEVRALSFGLNNNFELKVKEKNDSLDAKKKYKKISLLDNLTIGGSYNYAADTCKLSDIPISARTTLFKIFNINFSTTVSPYERINDSTPQKTLVSKKTKEYLWNRGKGIGDIIYSSLAFSVSLNSEKFSKKKNPDLKDRAAGMQATGADEQILRDIRNNPNLYLDFTIPWSVNINYILSYTRNYVPNRPADTYDHSITFSGDLSLSEKWKIQYNTGYNLFQKILTYTRLGITRDLHCWQMSLNWTPPLPNTGNTGFYNFQLNVKSSVLQDLKITKTRQWQDVVQY